MQCSTVESNVVEYAVETVLAGPYIDILPPGLQLGDDDLLSIVYHLFTWNMKYALSTNYWEILKC